MNKYIIIHYPISKGDALKVFKSESGDGVTMLFADFVNRKLFGLEELFSNDTMTSVLYKDDILTEVTAKSSTMALSIYISALPLILSGKKLEDKFK